jgi:hypothetical protein
MMSKSDGLCDVWRISLARWTERRCARIRYWQDVLRYPIRDESGTRRLCSQSHPSMLFLPKAYICRNRYVSAMYIACASDVPAAPTCPEVEPGRLPSFSRPSTSIPLCSILYPTSHKHVSLSPHHVPRFDTRSLSTLLVTHILIYTRTFSFAQGGSCGSSCARTVLSEVGRETLSAALVGDLRTI